MLYPRVTEVMRLQSIIRVLMKAWENFILYIRQIFRGLRAELIWRLWILIKYDTEFKEGRKPNLALLVQI